MAFEDGVFATFYDEPIEDKVASEEKGYPVFEPRLFIRIQVPNQSDCQPRPAQEADKMRFPQSWQAYLTGKEPAESGLPLEEWPQVTTSEVAMLKASGIKTVEQLAAVADSGIHRLGPSGHNLKNKANKFLESATELSSLQDRIKELERKLEKAESTPKTKRKVVRVAAQ